MSSQFPHFIQEHLIHSSDLHLSRKNRSKLALLRNLQFYEVHKKQVVNFIDLKNTVLNKVNSKLKSIVPVLNGTQNQSDILGTPIACSLPSISTVDSITIGKYIHQLLNVKNVYILIKCWESMVVIRKDVEGLTLQAEYEQVRSFKMCKSTDYQTRLEISFLNSNLKINTNFQEMQPSIVAFSKADTYKQTFDRIKMKQSELLVHKNITNKEFAKLKSTELFGCNYLRTTQVEELPILSKCGDAWYKVTADDDVVVGVPLVNNSSSRLTVIRHLRAVLNGSGDLNYKFTMYQLGTRLSDAESIQGFFQSPDNDDKIKNTWSECTDFYLRPEAFYVLALHLKINENINFGDENHPLFAFYDIVMSGRSFNQKCFLTALSFRGIFTSKLCRLNFRENQLHRDLLTVMCTCHHAETVLVFEFPASVDTFQDYLCIKLDFYRVSHRRNGTMHIDGQDEASDFQSERTYFYNKNKDSLWYGTLFAITYNSDFSYYAKLYAKTPEKLRIFFRLLKVELNLNCDMQEIRYGTRTLSENQIYFEAALRDECCSHLEMCSSNGIGNDQVDTCKKQDLQQKLHLNELKTDKMFKELLL